MAVGISNNQITRLQAENEQLRKEIIALKNIISTFLGDARNSLKSLEYQADAVAQRLTQQIQQIQQNQSTQAQPTQTNGNGGNGGNNGDSQGNKNNKNNKNIDGSQDSEVSKINQSNQSRGESREPVPIPKSVSVSKKGYVAYNLTSYWNSNTGSADHKKVLIGRTVAYVDKGSLNWREDPRMYSNKNYFNLRDVILKDDTSLNR